MVPTSLYLGFAASIIWVGQVEHISYSFYGLGCGFNLRFFLLTLVIFVRVHTSLLLLVVMQMITTCTKEQLSGNSMESFGEYLHVIRCVISLPFENYGC